MSFIIGKIIKEIFKQVVLDEVIFTMLKSRIIDFTEEKIRDSETETDDKLLLPVLDTLKNSKSDEFSSDLLRTLIDALSKNSNIIFIFIINHIEDYVLGSRSKLDDFLFLPPIKLLKTFLGV